jgi:ABC-2 type transport system permease protein
MSLKILFWDELKGFYKSKVMVTLWIGLPVITILLHYFRPKTDHEMSLALFSTLIITSLCATLASIMLAVNIIHEKSKGVYPLFLVRPVKRRDLLLSKFFAVYICIASAAVINIIVGLMIDGLTSTVAPAIAMKDALKSLFVGFSMMGISSSAGILIGVLSPSVLLGVILVLYGGNQVSVIAILPSILKLPFDFELTIIFGLIFTILILLIAIFFFKKKQF